MALSISDTVASGDNFLVSTGYRRYREISQTSMLTWIRAQFASPDPITQPHTPSDGFNIAMTQDGSDAWLLLKPIGALATGTIQIPASTVAIDGQVVECSSTYQVGSLTVTSAGATVNGAPTVLSSNDYFRLKYNLQTLSWYKTN